MVYSDILNESRLYCHIKYQENCLFFSLVDYRNSYFTSEDLNKIIEFYNGFDNREQLINWMRERPKGSSNIQEIEGENDIIIVIPTSDFKGKYAINCRENIFKGLHIIFVESGGREDFYFNMAHNCNVGIRKAMEYNPKWVIVSNDDITSSFSSKDLIYELSKIDAQSFNTVLSRESIQSATKNSVCKFSILGKFVYSFLKSLRLTKIIDQRHEVFFNSIKFNRKLRNEYFLLGFRKSLFNLFIKRLYSFYNYEAFGIFSSEFIKNNPRFLDETYVNAHEDQDISIVLSKEPFKIAWITNYKIEGIGGVSLGNNLQRGLRTIASDSYLNYKLQQGILIDI